MIIHRFILTAFSLLSVLPFYVAFGQTNQTFRAAFEFFNIYIRTNQTSNLDSSLTILNQRTLAEIDTTLTEKFFCNLVNLEKSRQQLKTNRKNKDLCDQVRIQFENVWNSLVNQEIRTFEGYQLPEDADLARSQRFAYYWYERILDIVIDFGIYFDSPAPFAAIAANISRRILIYPTVSDSNGFASYITVEDSLFWADFADILKIDYPNFGFTASFWRGENPDTSSLAGTNAMVRQRNASKISTAYYYAAMAHSRTNLCKYLSAAATGRSLQREAQVAINHKEEEEKYRKSVYYLEEALSILSDIEKTAELQWISVGGDTTLKRFKLLKWHYNPDVVRQTYTNTLESYALSLEDNDKDIESIFMWAKLWQYKYIEEQERLRVAKELYKRTNRLILQIEKLEDQDIFRQLQEIHHQVENFISKIKSE